MKYEFHPAAEDFPLMEGDELNGLIASMRDNGYMPQFPIYLYEGRILDGRNRYVASGKASVKPVFHELNGDTNPYAFALAANAHRRHLPFKTKLQIVANLLPKIRAEKEERKGKNLKKGREFPEGANLHLRENEKDTNEQIAEFLGVSERTASDVAKVVEHGSKQLVDAMTDGDVSISDAAKAAALPPKQQERAVKMVKAGRARTLKRKPSEKPEETKLKDELERDVPAELALVFTAAAAARKTLALMNQVTKQVGEFAESPGGTRFRGQQFRLDFKNARNTLRFDIPYAVCPVCGGSDKKRKGKCFCRDSGWVNETEYGQLPTEYRA